MDIHQMVDRQNKFYKTGKTQDVAFRRDRLKKLLCAMEEMEEEILQALCKDLGKSGFEGYMTEVGMARSELNHMIRHVNSYSRERRVKTPLAQFPARSFTSPHPYGTVLIMSPWNYPFLLTMGPLIDAIAAGNTAVVKPSAYSAATASVIEKLIQHVFPAEYVAVVQGGRAVNGALLDEKFDYIFFTGGKTVGRLVMEKAAVHLTPITLELGGKSPCIVDASADLQVAARRIVFGKYLNAGQTCVAPDYLLVDRSVKDWLVSLIQKEITLQFGKEPLENDSYGKIINEKHYLRLMGLMENEKIVAGGGGNREQCRIAPTVLDEVTPDAPVMQEEIFGPILPVLPFDSEDQMLEIIEKNPTPLALYLFTRRKSFREKVLRNVQFGGGCINDTIIHLATENMGFGGVGASGMGKYHGKDGFDTFTHRRSIVDKKTWMDIPLRYQPYTKKAEKLLRLFLK